MYTIAGSWEGELISDDGRPEEQFLLVQPSAQRFMTPTMTLYGQQPAAFRLLESACNALVALAEAVPDPVSGRLGQLLLEVRVRGDRLVGRWLRRDDNGEIVREGVLIANRIPKAA